METENLQDRVAFVTGGSAGIGRAVARRLLSRQVTVVIAGRSRPAIDEAVTELATTGGRVHGVKLDVTVPEAVREALAAVNEKHGSLSIVVASAGVAHLASFEHQNPDHWQSMIATNVVGWANTAHAAIPHLLSAAEQTGLADLVLISSTGGRRALAWNNVYSATKHAANALAESMRQELTERMVRVGIVAPGMVDTAMTAAIEDRPNFPYLAASDVAEAVEFMVSQPRGRAVNELVLRPSRQVS